MEYEIDMDLCMDYSELVKSWMKCRGIQSDKDSEDLWYDFSIYRKKSVQPQKRTVLYSKRIYLSTRNKHGVKTTRAKV